MPPAYRSCFRNDLFERKIALVTGGGSGIGLIIAKELASLGATVVIAGRDKDKCQAAVDEYNKTKQATKLTGSIVVGPSTNIRDAEQVAALVTFCVKTHGGLHLLVNNAGGQFISPASMLSKRGFQAVVETNLIGTFLVSQQAYLQYMQENGGSIVNITLVNTNGLPGMSHSAASRAAVENLTKTLALEWMEAGVRVNCVRPGIIWTESGFAAYGDVGEEFLAKLLPSIPAKRLGTPEEVSSAVVWLLSQGSSYVTGTTLGVDGGADFTWLPLIDIPNTQNLSSYGEQLPRKARL
jgi:NAD(P)-dependent dehydrogenase (short-subunit alcohol dehydrogenase family)